MPLQLPHESVIGPRGLSNELLQGPHDATVNGLGNVLHAASVRAQEQTLNETVGMILGLVPTEQRGIPREEQIEFGFELTQRTHVHVQPPDTHSKRSQTRLVPTHAPA